MSIIQQSIAAVRRRFSSRRSTATVAPHGNDSPTDEQVRLSRRGFFKKAAVSTASIAGTAGLAKTVVDKASRADLKELYHRDAVAGEQELKQREYVLMSDQEKADMVQSFIEDYADQS